MTPSESWKPLDIDAPDAANLPRPGEGIHVVALVATAGARSGGWSARAAIEVVRGWGARGARVLLCDLALEEPELHRAAGMDNLEGVSDALLFGTSFQRLGRPLAEGLFLASAGTAVPDGEALLAHPRWRDFAAGFREADAVLALYVPAEARGVDALLRIADAALILAEEGESRGPDLPSRVPVLARVGPVTRADVGEPDTEAPEAWDALSETPTSDGGGFEAPELEVPAFPEGPAGVGAAEADPLGSFAPEWEEPGAATRPSGHPAELEAPFLDEILRDDPRLRVSGPGEVLPPPPGARPARTGPAASSARTGAGTGRGKDAGKRGSGSVLLRVLLGVVMVLLVAGRMGWVDLPWITPSPGTVDETGAAEPLPGAETPMEEGASAAAAEFTMPAAAADPAVVPESPVAAFSLALVSYSRADSALARARLLGLARPDLQFLVVPVEVQGTPFFRLLAGGSADAASVEGVRESLAGDLPGADGWIVRGSGLAFLVGSHGSLAVAERQVEALAAAGIPAHVLRYDDGAGVSGFRVYAGAFANPGEARYMARLLEENGIQNVSLTERRGVRPE